MRPSITKILSECNSVEIGLFENCTALRMLQSVVAKSLKIKNRKSLESEQDINDIKKDFKTLVNERYAALFTDAGREIMRFYGQVRRLLPSGKSYHLLAYLRENKESATANMEVQYELNLKVLPHMMKIIADLNSELDTLRKASRGPIASKQRKQSYRKRSNKDSVNGSQKTTKAAENGEIDAQSIRQPRRSERIAKRISHKTRHKSSITGGS